VNNFRKDNQSNNYLKTLVIVENNATYSTFCIFAKMVRYPAQMVAKVLYQEFPDLALKVDAKIREKVPDTVLTDFSMINEIVLQFCALEDFHVDDLHDCSKSRSHSNARRILFAVILNLFNPELLHNLIDGSFSPKGRKSIEKALGLSKRTVNYDMCKARNYYKIYRDFRTKVDLITSKIIESYGNKENRSNGTPV